ncbi:hypothetical protein H632_c5360p0, partial [Helicosporidium sp. ATCC 50920]
MDPRIQIIPSRTRRLDAEKPAPHAVLHAHEQPTSGIVYADVALEARHLPARLLPLFPLFCRSLTNMGGRGEGLAELTDRIGRLTGGVSASPLVTCAQQRAEEPKAFLLLRGKAVAGKAPDLFRLLGDVAEECSLRDCARFREMVLETRAGLEAGALGAGNALASSRLD